MTIGCHRNFVSTYTSKERLNRHRKRESCAAESDPSQPPTKQRRSAVQGFSFKSQCIFCGESCTIEKDKKHPDRWRRAVQCRTAYASPGKKSFKESILRVCDQRKDNVTEQVRFRVEGALSDLHAADARYHVDCMTNFMSPNSIAAAENASTVNVNEDPAFDSVTEEMVKDKSRLWSSVQLHHLYQLLGGKIFSRRALLLQIKEHFSDEIAVLSSPGLASTVVFNHDATTVLNLLRVPEDDQEETSIENLSKNFVSEVKQIKFECSSYDIRITKEDMSTYVSPTLMDLLAAMTGNLKNTLPALLIGNIVTSALSSKPTNLQIALGNLLRDHKSIVKKLYRFGMTCSYDEIIRFKKSATLEATKDLKLSGIHEGRFGLIQRVADNFDADISSQNGKVTTHSLTMLITQPKTALYDDQTTHRESITRIQKSDMGKGVEYDNPVRRYQGPKTVLMPEKCSKKNALPLKVLCSALIAEK